MDLKGRDFLKLLDFSSEEIEYLISLAASLKVKKKVGIAHKYCEGKNIFGQIGCLGCLLIIAQHKCIRLFRLGDSLVL